MLANFPLASHRGKGGTKQMNFTNLSLPMRKPISLRILQKVRTYETKRKQKVATSSKLLTPPICRDFMYVVLFSFRNLEGLQVQVTIATIIDFGQHSLKGGWLCIRAPVQLGVPLRPPLASQRDPVRGWHRNCRWDHQKY